MGVLGGLALLVALVGLYFLPTIVANNRRVPNLGSIFVINIFLGWTVVGWVVALAMAFRDPPSPPAYVGVPTRRRLEDPPRLPAAPTPESASPADEIEKLAALHARGVLSNEEFQAAKARLLGAPPE